MIVQNLELMNNNNQRFDKKDLGELMNNIKDLGKQVIFDKPFK